MSVRELTRAARRLGYRLVPIDQPTEGLPTEAARVLTAVARSHWLTVDELIGDARDQEVVHPRQEAMWLLRQLDPVPSYPAIGRWMGGRDHTTILHGARAHAKRMGQEA